MGQMFEYFAAEYGWTHNYILDHLTPSQFKLYSELLLCRLDDLKIERQELATIQAGGDLKEFHNKRKPLRNLIKNKKDKEEDKVVNDGIPSDIAKKWLSKMGSKISGKMVI